MTPGGNGVWENFQLTVNRPRPDRSATITTASTDGARSQGGYQFVGRTTQVWNHRHPHDARSFEPGTPGLLRYFDRIGFYPVSAEELLDLRADMAAGRGDVEITDGDFTMSDYHRFLSRNADGIAGFRAQQAEAFAAERQAGGPRR